MKKTLFFVIFAMLCVSFQAYSQSQDVQIGDILTIEEPSGDEYEYIHFPKRNMIIKRGGIPDMDMVKNLKVEVVDVTYTASNEAIVTLKRVDGGRFFKSLFSVKAEFSGALNAGELSS